MLEQKTTGTKMCNYVQIQLEDALSLAQNKRMRWNIKFLTQQDTKQELCGNLGVSESHKRISKLQAHLVKNLRVGAFQSNSPHWQVC